jgi:thiamine biosynthesis lipoprotein
VLLNSLKPFLHSQGLKHGLLSIIFLFYLAGISGCTEKTVDKPLLTLDGLTMGTTFSMRINDADLQVPAEKIIADVNEILVDVNNKMSTYINDSELSLLNQNKELDWIPLSKDLHYVINEAVMISELTQGSFDITVGPLVNMWGFGPKKKSGEIPLDSDINEALAETGFEKIQLNSKEPTIRKLKPNIYIDLSGIAKGYGVDLMADYLDKLNVVNYMVEIGGEIRAKGINEKNTSWRVGIEKPLTEQRIVQRVINLDNISMATSGDYRNYFEKDGQRYSHTIDPRSGRPITHKLVSVTVLDESATRADALATGFLVMGKNEAYKLATRENMPVLFIEKTADGFSESYTVLTIENISLLLAIVIISLVWFESLRVREMAIRHCHRLCRETNLQLLDQTVSLVSISLRRAETGTMKVLRKYQFEVSENGVDRYSGYITLLGSRIIESRLEGPDGLNTFHQSDPYRLH